MNKYLILLGVMIVILEATFAQEIPFFEGSISYSVKLSGSQASIIQQNEPNTIMQMHIRNADYITLLKGGRYPKTFMFLADSNREYSVDFADKVAYQYSPYTDRVRQKKERPAAKATGKTAMVNDLECKVYKVVTDDTQFLYFVHDEYKVNADLFPQKIRARPFFLIPGLDGRIPLKVIKKQKGLTVTQEVTKVSRREFDPEQFAIPPDFEVKKRDYRH